MKAFNSVPFHCQFYKKGLILMTNVDFDVPSKAAVYIILLGLGMHFDL
jgi:hypothetical protein